MINRKHKSRLFSFLLILTLVADLSVPAFAETGDNTGEISWTKISEAAAGVSLPWRTANTDITPTPLNSGDGNYNEEAVRVSIYLEKDSTLEAGYSTEDIANNEKAMKYRDKLRTQQESIEKKISSKVLDGDNLDVVWNVTLIENIISANVPYDSIEEIKTISGVQDVVIETACEPCLYSKGGDDPSMATSTSMTGTTSAWANGYTGAGSRIAIIDTGIDTDHQSFSESGYEYSLKCNAEELDMTVDEYKTGLNLLSAKEVADKWEELNISSTYEGKADTTYFSTKIPFGFNYVDNCDTITHDEDDEGEHGSHVAGIAAANCYIPDGIGIFTHALESVKTQGVAPDAQLIVMKVFGKNGGAYPSDFMVAIEDAIILGADSVNLSLGSGNSGASANSVYKNLLDSLAESDTVVTVSAGNKYAWPRKTISGYLYSDGVNFDTVSSPASYTNTMTVASVENIGFTGEYFTLGEDMIMYTPAVNVILPEFSSLSETQEYVYIDSIGTQAEFEALSEVIKGRVAICNRGVIPFTKKAESAEAVGAIACVFVNNAPGTTRMDLSGGSVSIPCVSVLQSAGEKLKASAEYIEEGDYYLGSMNISDTVGTTVSVSDYYTMSSFTSMGVPGSLELKPEITAPGGNIYSVNGAEKGGTAYEQMSGTSMAAPQVAGMSALVAQYIRENKLEAATGLSSRQLTQSLIMSTAEPIIEEDSGTFYSVMLQGAGLANVGSVISSESYIMMDSEACSAAEDGKIKAELGDDPDRTGKYSFSFELNNMSDTAKSFNLSASMFTQDVFEDDGQEYLDTACTPLEASAKWYSDGKRVAAKLGQEIKNCDFNGDGKVTEEDGEALLEYVTGSLSSISKSDYADIDGDEDIDTHDAYLFFKKFSSGVVVVPANGKVKVSVSISLKDISDYDDCGAYVEGFVFADELSSDEGEAGDSHSIPVLAYYGGWDESPMFDVGSYLEYSYGLESRLPYMYAASEEKSLNNNAYYIRHSGEGKSYPFGGNPFIKDEKYMPWRNAINSMNGSEISKVCFTAVRDAAASMFSVTRENGSCVYSEEFGAVISAFYNINNSSWVLTNKTRWLEYVPEGITEGTRLSLNMTLAPEYYVKDDGSVDWDALDSAATFSVPFVIDNTAPEIEDVELVKDPESGQDSLVLSARDNQYIAAVALFNSDGDLIGRYGSDADADAGDITSFSFPLTEAESKYLIQVYDYASNCSSYKINMNKEEAAGEISLELSDSDIELIIGENYTLSAEVSPWGTPDASVIWTSDNDEVATVNEYGTVKGISTGSAVITATSAADNTKTASCRVTVVKNPITLNGLLQDSEGTPYAFSWNLETDKSYKTGKELDTFIYSYVYDRYNEYPADPEDSNTDYYHIGYIMDDSSMMHAINTGSWEILETSENPTESGALITDMDFMYKYNELHDSQMLLGIAGSSVLSSSSPMENSFNKGVNYANALSQGSGADRFTAIAWYGITTDNLDVFLLLDNKNTMWVLTFDGTTFILKKSETELDLDWPTEDGHQFCSMITGEDDKLYLSYFTGETNELYQLDYSESKKCFKSRYIGDFGNDVFPVLLGNAALNDTEAETEPEVSEELLGNLSEYNVSEYTLIDFNEQSEATVDSQSQASLYTEDDEGYMSVNVSASDFRGRGIYSNNGLIRFSYNEDCLQLTDVKVFTDYKCVNGNTIGYADLKGVPAGMPVARLVFKVKSSSDTSVCIETAEVNNDKSNYKEITQLSGKSSGKGSSSKKTEEKEDKPEIVPDTMPFADVLADDYYYNAVLWAVKNNIASGVDDSNFKPDGYTTRAQMISFLWRAAGCPEPASKSCRFTDVSSDDYFYKAVLWAAEKGIAKGISDTEFDPDARVTRAQAVSFLWRYNGSELYSGKAASAGFKDVSSDDYYYNAVIWAKAEGITAGKTNTLFAPDDNCLRCEIITFIYRSMGK